MYLNGQKKKKSFGSSLTTDATAISSTTSADTQKNKKDQNNHTKELDVRIQFDFNIIVFSYVSFTEGE